jgi:Ca2+-binding EF-hand superfamily protein
MSKLSGCAVMAVVITLVQLLLLASGNCHAQNQPVEDSAAMFNNFDRDRDGFLSQAEIGAYKWGRYDSNGDGAVSRDEFLAGRAADKKEAAETRDLEKAFTLLDWNEDGWLSGTELDGKWGRFDQDANNRVYKEEFIRGRSTELGLPAPAGGGGAPNQPAPPQQGDKGLWGQKLDAIQQTDLVKFFGLTQTGTEADFRGGKVVKYQPKTGNFRTLVLVKCALDNADRIRGVELSLARSFVEHETNKVFARDIAKSLLRTVLPTDDIHIASDLLNEIEFGNHKNRIVVNPESIPQLPAQPTPGYQVYLGTSPAFEQNLAQTRLSLRNATDFGQNTLVITIAPKEG